MKRINFLSIGIAIIMFSLFSFSVPVNGNSGINNEEAMSLNASSNILSTTVVTLSVSGESNRATVPCSIWIPSEANKLIVTATPGINRRKPVHVSTIHNGEIGSYVLEEGEGMETIISLPAKNTYLYMEISGVDVTHTITIKVSK